MLFPRSIGKHKEFFHGYFKTRLQSLNKDIKINLLFFCFVLAKCRKSNSKTSLGVWNGSYKFSSCKRLYGNSFPKRQGYPNRRA